MKYVFRFFFFSQRRFVEVLIYLSITDKIFFGFQLQILSKFHKTSNILGQKIFVRGILTNGYVNETSLKEQEESMNNFDTWFLKTFEIEQKLVFFAFNKSKLYQIQDHLNLDRGVGINGRQNWLELTLN